MYVRSAQKHIWYGIVNAGGSRILSSITKFWSARISRIEGLDF